MFSGKELYNCIDPLVESIRSANDNGRLHEALALVQESQVQVGHFYDELDALRESNAYSLDLGLRATGQPVQGNGIWSNLYFTVEPEDVKELLGYLEEQFTELMRLESKAQDRFMQIYDHTPVTRFRRDHDEVDMIDELLGTGTFVIPREHDYYHAPFSLSYEKDDGRTYVARVMLTGEPDHRYWCGEELGKIFETELSIYVIDPCKTEDIMTLFRVGCEKYANRVANGGRLDGESL